jgi:O-acetyl-ADP-ribose deacetylase (regulator of RNase III)
MKTTTGNLLDLADAECFDIIIHGCNCWHAMGGGIAAQIAQRWPQVLEADKDTKLGSINKVGGYSFAHAFTRDGAPFAIVNAYTQHRPGRDARLEAIEKSMRAIANDAMNAGLVPMVRPRIGYPMIGCGIGGLKWEDVAPIMDAAFDGFDHTLVVLKEGQ